MDDYNTQCFELNDSATDTSEVYNGQQQNDEPASSVSTEQEDTPAADALLWSIDDDTLFHPHGLINHGTAGKSVFVTWSEDYLLNFVFKSKRAADGGKQRISLTKVRLAIPPAEQIKAILILELNALLLMDSGHVYYFSSVKAMHGVPWLHGIRCMAASKQGFSVIRVLEDNSVHLEVYSDVMNLGRSENTLQQAYDVSFDALNIFNSQWREERFTLVSKSVDAVNLEFMQQLCGNVQLTVEQEVHLFSVSRNLFALIPVTTQTEDTSMPNYQIQTLCIYASNIEFIKIHTDRQLCLVFLQCGTIDIWYMSTIARSLQRQSHQTGTQYTHFDYAPHGCFYYTDEEKVAQLKFNYDVASDTCLVQETFKAVPGIVACTWVESLQQLICLNINNIFHKLIFESVDGTPKKGTLESTVTNEVEFENLADLYELTPSRITKLLAKAQIVDELNQVPAQVHAAIEAEFVKQQLIAVASKTQVYKHNFEACLVYSKQLPASYEQETVLIHTNASHQLHSSSLFALIYLRISKNDIFHAAHWQLHLDYAGKMHMLHVPRTLLQHQLCIALPLSWRSAQLLPSFKLQLLAFVAHETDFLAVALPVELTINAHTYAGLFSDKCATFTICAEYSLTQLIANFNKEAKTAVPTLISHAISLPKNSNFNAVLEAFNASQLNAVDTEELQLYVMSDEIRILYDESSNSVNLESRAAAALYYAKLYLLLKLWPTTNFLQTENANDDAEMRRLSMQYQSAIERCYDVLEQMDNLGDEQPDDKLDAASNALHVENLKRTYTKIRSEFCNIFR